MINKAILIGRLGKDVEVKKTANNMSLGRFSVATSEKRKVNGGYADMTEWHNIVVFGKVAENCEKYINKGSQVYIEGRIQTKKWQDKEGRDRYTTEIVANTVQFLDSKKDVSYNSQRSVVATTEPLAQTSINSAVPSFEDDNIPF